MKTMQFTRDYSTAFTDFGRPTFGMALDQWEAVSAFNCPTRSAWGHERSLFPTVTSAPTEYFTQPINMAND